MVLSGAKLTGGLVGTTPTISFFETRTYSSNVIFNPINENFMHMTANSPNIIVTVNGLKSICLNSCSYSFLPNTPMITSQTLSGSQIAITVSNPQNLPYGTDMIIATVDGQPCQILSGGTFTSFTCQLNQNTDGSPVLKAGDYNVNLVVMEVGILPFQAGVSPMNYQLEITNAGPASGGNNGGAIITIDGHGFPSNSADANIVLCGVNATIVSITNTQTKIIAPQCSNTGL